MKVLKVPEIEQKVWDNAFAFIDLRSSITWCHNSYPILLLAPVLLPPPFSQTPRKFNLLLSI